MLIRESVAVKSETTGLSIILNNESTLAEEEGDGKFSLSRDKDRDRLMRLLSGPAEIGMVPF